MKNPNHLTMADQSALNLLAKVTNKFESEGTNFRKSNKGNICHRLRDMPILIIFARESGACRTCGHNRFRQNQSWSVPEDGHAQKRCAIGGDTLPCGKHQQQ